MSTKTIGEAINRVDGVLKVTGTANYAVDWPVKNIAYAYLVKSTVAAGTITNIDTAAAENAPGVLAVITHKSAQKLGDTNNVRGGGMLQTPKVEFYGEHIGIVVAETYEQARHAARLIKVTYQESPGRVDFEKVEPEAVKPQAQNRADTVRGDFDAAFNASAHKVDAVFDTPIEHHQPMEPHSTIAAWENGKLTVYNGSQIVN